MALDEELSRTLAICRTTPYWRAFSFSLMPLTKGGDAWEWLLAHCLDVYTLDKTHPLVQGFLKGCNDSALVEQDLFNGRMQGTQEQMDELVLEEMTRRGLIETVEEEDEEDETDES